MPIRPKALFWLSFKVEHPPIDGTFYVFKFFVNNMEVATWCCDAENSFKGKVMFGLFDTDEPTEGGKGLEKRVFQFGPADSRVVGNLSGDKEEDRFLEVRVCRASVKRRVEPQRYISRAPCGTDVDLVWAGYSKPMAPHRYFKFGLIDAVDQPYATFRFYYRSWEEIDKLGLHMGQVESEGGSLFDQTVDEPDAVGPPGRNPMQHPSRNYPFLDHHPAASEHWHGISGDHFDGHTTRDHPPVSLNQHTLNGLPYQPRLHSNHPTGTLPYSNDGFGTYSAAMANQYGYHQSDRTLSASFHPQVASNFTTPFKCLSIPPALLFQPLLSKGPLLPSPAKLAAKQQEAVPKENSSLCPPPALTSAELNLKSPLQDIPSAPRNTPWVPPRETPSAQSPRKLVKRRSEESELSGGSFIDRVLLRRSREKLDL